MNTTLSTTLRLLRESDACKDRYVHLRQALGKEYGDDTPIPLFKVLEVNGLEDALWALQAVPTEQTAHRDTIARLLAADYAARVLQVFEQRYPDDRRPRLTIETVRAFARGKATQTDLAAARDAAWAARAAAWAAWAAAWAAAGGAAWDVAGDVAWDVAGDVAWGAARAAGGVAWDAERRWQEQRLRQYLTATRLPRPVPLPRRPR